MVYGWGKKSKEWGMPDGRTLICQYSYVSLMFVFKFVWARKWHLIGRDRAMDLQTDRAELERIYGEGHVPDIGIFERFGIFITAGVFALIMLGSFMVQTILGFGPGEAETAAVGTDGPVAEAVGRAENAKPDEDSDSGADASSSSIEDAVDEQVSEVQDGGGATAETADDQGADADNFSASASEESAATSGATYQVADIPQPADGQRLASTNPSLPKQGWSELTVNEIYAAFTSENTSLQADEKLVVVEYQLIQKTGQTNVKGGAFRLEGDGVQYPLEGPRTNTALFAGEAYNSAAWFIVPAEQNDFRFEAGAIDPLGDGFQTSYEFTLRSGEAPPLPERFAGPDQSGSITQVSESNLFTGAPGIIAQSPHQIQVLDAKATAMVGPDAAAPGFKFVVVEVQAKGTAGSGNLQRYAFRMKAEGELYPGDADVNTVVSSGEVWSGPIVFEIPSMATTVELEAGVPEGWEDGERAVFEITLG